MLTRCHCFDFTIQDGLCYPYPMWTAAAPLAMTQEQRNRLEIWARAGTSSLRLPLRAQICLMAADGLSNNAIAKRLKTSRPTVLLWRKRFEKHGPDGLLTDAPHGPSPRRLDGLKTRAIVEATLETTPPGMSRWTTRIMAKAHGVSRSTVARIWSAYGLKPHRDPQRKLTEDRRGEKTSTDMMRLSVSPPEKTLMVCVADLLAAIEDYLKIRHPHPGWFVPTQRVDRILKKVDHCIGAMETLRSAVVSLALTEGRGHSTNGSEGPHYDASPRRRDEEVAMNLIEKLRMHFAAAAFAEEGEYETAARMVGLPAAAAAQSVGVLHGLATTFAAAAFAEENCPEMAREILAGGPRKKGFLERVGLEGVRVYYGTSAFSESFAEAVGLAGVPFKVMTVRL